jgi:surface protein
MVFVKNKGTYDAYVRSVFAFEANGYTLDEFKSLFHLNINEEDWTWEWEEEPVSIPGENGSTNYIIATATYNKVLKPGQLTEISLSQIALDPSAGNADILGFGDTYQVLVKTQAMQAEGFNDPKAALDEGFGNVSLANLPWENDDPIRGIDLKTAMHHLNGQSAKVITKNVTSIVFGSNSEYPQIVDGYDGTLVDVEQDVPAYAYYVPHGGNYDVFILSGGTVYAPKDSSYLFGNMSALTSIDTHNLDVSRVTNMKRMFSQCTNLKEVDVEHFDTSNVTSFDGIFFNDMKIENLDVSNWKTGNVTTMYAAFYNCNVLNELDVADWDVRKVRNMEFTFAGCNKFKTLNVANWDVSNVTSFDAFFQSARKTNADMQLEYLDAGNWDTSSCTNLDRMFFGCGKLRYVDMSNWNTENVTDTGSMFYSCSSLETLYASEKWSTESITYSSGMFSGCNRLTGGNGTKFAGDSVAYACVDTPECAGYFTYKAPID